MSKSKQKYFPLKPDSEEGFKDPVSWLGGRELITSLKSIIIYSFYGESIDPRPWMKPEVYPGPTELTGMETPEQKQILVDKALDEGWKKKNEEYREWKKERFEFWRDYYDGHSPGDDEEFWFDYIADSGDGQRGVYGVGCLCLSDLWAAKDKVGACVGFHPDDTARPPDAAASEKPDCEKRDPDDEPLFLPRGSFLFIGGDTAYHVADYSSVHERFQLPFRWAFADVRKHLIRRFGKTGSLEKYYFNDQELEEAWSEDQSKPAGDQSRFSFHAEWDGTLSKLNREEQDEYWDSEPLRPIFGLPANHDYYDDLDGFNRQFRRPPFKIVDENRKSLEHSGKLLLKIPTFRREQEASYMALRLPFDWWLLGIDSENKKLDFRQRAFFGQLMKNEVPRKVIVATPEPTTVFGRKCDPATDKTARYLDEITEPIGLMQPFLQEGRLEVVSQNRDGTAPDFKGGSYCRLDLSGDVHHYARFWGPPDPENGQPEHASKNYASLVSGGGGAFFDSTNTFIGSSEVTKNGRKKRVPGEIPPQIVFPERDCAHNESADRILDLSNIRKGGYIQIVGAVISVLIYWLLGIDLYTRNFFVRVLHWQWGGMGDWWGVISIVAGLGPFVVAGILLHNLNKRLNDPVGEGWEDNDNGRIIQLKWPVICFVAGAAFYLLAIWRAWPVQGMPFMDDLHPYLKSFLLLTHLSGVGVLLWIGAEYLNWLPHRFKFIRQSGAVPESWLALIFGTSDKKIDKSLGKGNNLKKRLWESYKKKSVENFPVYIVNAYAVAMLIIGIYLFGGRSVIEFGQDFLITLIIIGALAGLIALAVSVGAAYHKKTGEKIGFSVIGFWHALLQMLTPIVIVYYGDVWTIVAVIVLSIIMNGFAGVHTALKFVVSDIDRRDNKGWKKIVGRLATARLGAWIMKRNNAWLFFAGWVVYGLAVLALPWTVKWLAGPNFTPLRSLAETQTRFSWLPCVILLAVAGYLGYRMSRVWASWYFAVSLAYNGHNNEAGGAARIQGFKHILRIKVEKEKLTVYVIGFDHPETKLADLKPRLVDRFELETAFLPPSVHATASFKPKPRKASGD